MLRRWALAAILFGGLSTCATAPVAFAQQLEKVCVQTANTTSGVVAWSCQDVTNTNPFPVGSAPYTYTALGYQQITSLSAATTLTVPAGAKLAQICVETQGVRYRDDGTAPTSTVGQPVASGTCFQYSGPLAAIQFIQQSSSAAIDVSYYK